MIDNCTSVIKNVKSGKFLQESVNVGFSSDFLSNRFQYQLEELYRRSRFSPLSPFFPAIR